MEQLRDRCCHTRQLLQAVKSEEMARISDTLRDEVECGLGACGPKSEGLRDGDRHEILVSNGG